MKNALECSKIETVAGWVRCPKCGDRRLLRVTDSTEARNLIVYCRKCKTELTLTITRGQSIQCQSQ